MKKIKDRDTLSIVSGMIGLAGLMLTDGISQKAKISKRSFRQAAAGVFVSKSEAKNLRGQVLGVIMNSAVSILGANYIINRMSQNGRDKLVSKGITSGIIFGAIATAIPNLAPWNKMKPRDAASNLSYVFSNIVFGLLATFSAAKLGHDSLFDPPPQNNYLKPTEKTSEQIKESNRNTVQPTYSDVNLNKEDGASKFI
ncbi:hypothetical protein Desaci_1974 [Desulfosporosinus acidiphilus SJ4]|uniref:Uncharacterized protein n=1 Tax=Desulfosporosinus acidiphilus (strain DSM 22704 / JCM 16185 / SJ4) TaxID=646529 RepID=I4D577_DESAJ|nr:hypothetical protein [Desulfosporosinus acidiphilus]AFM40951.1 hypothetical protein Desaci_1974 [Desulfosporosinus acidiphilus SJ4]